jgi:hypothetical protein
VTVQDPRSATILFVRDSNDGGVPSAGPPDGAHATALVTSGLFGNPPLRASTDGSVLALTSYTVDAAGRATPTYWVDVRGVAHEVPIGRSTSADSADVAADGRAVYYAVGGGVLRYDTTTSARTRLCTGCLPAGNPAWARRDVVVSPDERTVAVTQVVGSRLYGGPIDARVTVVDVATGRVLWEQQGRERTGAQAWLFADDDTLVTTVGVGHYGATPAIHRVTGFRSAHVSDTATGVVGYGPIAHVDGVWWYYRDATGPTAVTSVYVNPDLTPAGERKLTDRVDGATTRNYEPVTTAPAAITLPPAGASG